MPWDHLSYERTRTKTKTTTSTAGEAGAGAAGATSNERSSKEQLKTIAVGIIHNDGIY
jgi:hypothetical protein